MTDANAWHQWPSLGFDLETTAANPLEAWPVTASLVRTHPREDTVVRRWLIRPDGWEIPEEAQAIHGISTEHALEHGEPIDDVLAEVVDHLRRWLEARYPVAAMNAAYDFTCLDATIIRLRTQPNSSFRVGTFPTLAEQLGGRARVGPVVDPFVLDRYADRYRKGSRKLGDLCALYGVDLGDDAHDSDADALAACRLWPKIIAAHPDKFVGMSLKGLHLSQVGWRREQCDGLRAYFDRNRTPHDGVDPGWPYLTTLPPEVKP